jgi:hypothetical protein
MLRQNKNNLKDINKSELRIVDYACMFRPRVEVFLNDVRLRVFKTTRTGHSKTIKKVYSKFNIPFPKNKESIYFQHVNRPIKCEVSLAHVTGGTSPHIIMKINGSYFKKFKTGEGVPVKTLGRIMYNYNINPMSNTYYKALHEQIRKNRE